MTTSPGRAGFFIVIESSEGCGKSTQFALLKERLTNAGFNVVHTREPGGTPMAEEIRGVLLAKRDETVCDMAELLLLFAARAQHLNNLILPELANGSVVICERWVSSTICYQHFGRGLDRAKIENLSRLVIGDFRPDLTLILDLDPAIGLRRVERRGEKDRFELENIEFFHKVRQGFLQMASEDPEQFKVIGADQSIEAVHADIYEAIQYVLLAKHLEGSVMPCQPAG